MLSEPQGAAFHTKTMLRGMLALAGLSPRKRHGQHFLIDRNLMTKLLESAELHRSDCVLEVGTGTGCLTSFLAERVGHVVTAEIDERLAAVARENLARFGNITLVCGDALAGKTAVAEPLLRGRGRWVGVEERLAEAGGESAL